MKLYDGGPAPNPRRVRMFLAEKGLVVPIVPVSLLAGEHRTEAFSALNPMRELPVLVTDEGEVITESIAICRYFEMKQPDPPLFGVDPMDAVRVDMWQRRLEGGLLYPVAHVYRHRRRSMATLEVPQIPDWANSNEGRVMRFLAWFDTHLDGRDVVHGDRFTVADITGFIAVTLMDWGRMAVPEALANVRRWHASIASRPSAGA